MLNKTVDLKITISKKERQPVIKAKITPKIIAVNFSNTIGSKKF